MRQWRTESIHGLVMVASHGTALLALAVACAIASNRPIGNTTDNGATNMGAVAAPDGWELTTGIWGVDADREDSIVQSGIHSIHLMPTAVATTVLSPKIPIPRDDEINLSYWVAYPNMWVYARQDDFVENALNTVSVYVDFYDDADSVVSTRTAWNARLGGAGVWWIVGDRPAGFNSNWRYARLRVTKAARSFDVYIDAVWADITTPHSEYGQNDAGGIQTIVADWSWQSVLDLRGGKEAEVIVAADGSNIMALIPGVYAISGTVTANDDLTGTQTMKIRAKIGSIYKYGTVATATSPACIVSAIYPLQARDTVEIQVATGLPGGLPGTNIELKYDALASDEYYNHVNVVRVGR